MNKRLQKLLEDQGAHPGNAWTDLQYSNFIRPAHETECNGFTFPPNRLRDFDLKPYRSTPRHAFAVALAERYKDRKCILYLWRTKYAIYGASITDEHNLLLDRVILSGPHYTQSVLELEAAAGIRLATADRIAA